MSDKPVTAGEVVRVIDPDNVREILVTGGTNVARMGPYILITHTIARQNSDALFANRAQAPDLVVVSRLLMEVESAKAMANHLLAACGETGEAGPMPDFGKPN